jgi:hypothetical protein
MWKNILYPLQSLNVSFLIWNSRCPPPQIKLKWYSMGIWFKNLTHEWTQTIFDLQRSCFWHCSLLSCRSTHYFQMNNHWTAHFKNQDGHHHRTKLNNYEHSLTLLLYCQCVYVVSHFYDSTCMRSFWMEAFCADFLLFVHICIFFRNLLIRLGDPFNWFNSTTLLYLSQTRTWISNAICYGVVCVQWFNVKFCPVVVAILITDMNKQ